MKTQAAPTAGALKGPKPKVLVASLLAVALAGGIVYDTKVVRIGSVEDVREQVFSPAAFGASTFPRIRDSVLERAVDAAVLYQAINADKAAASKEYGVAAGIGAVFPIAFEGVVGEGKSGIFRVAVDGLPEKQVIRVQTGPAINGTDLRDATGTIEFGHFKNQIEYQNAGAAINNAMKAEVLAELDTNRLSGERVRVVGVFKLINPKNWLVTPVRFEVQ